MRYTLILPQLSQVVPNGPQNHDRRHYAALRVVLCSDAMSHGYPNFRSVYTIPIRVPCSRVSFEHSSSRVTYFSWWCSGPLFAGRLRQVQTTQHPCPKLDNHRSLSISNKQFQTSRTQKQPLEVSSRTRVQGLLAADAESTEHMCCAPNDCRNFLKQEGCWASILAPDILIVMRPASGKLYHAPNFHSTQLRGRFRPQFWL
jgi:hypothetical protein